MVDGIGDAIGDTLREVGEVVGDVLREVGDVVDTVLDTVGDVTDEVLDVVGDTVDTVLDGVGDVAGGVLDGIGGLTGITAISDAGDAVDNALDDAGDAVDDALDDAGDAVDEGMDDAGDATEEGTDDAGDTVDPDEEDDGQDEGEDRDGDDSDGNDGDVPDADDSDDERRQTGTEWDNAEGDTEALPDPETIYTTPERQDHILDGDPNDQESGGHRHGEGRPNKTEFPADWSDDDVIDNVEDVAANPDQPPRQLPDGKWEVQGERDGVNVRVIVRPDGSIETAHPTHGEGVVKNDRNGVPHPKPYK